MPEGRLRRTREAKPEIPACIRLDHFWRYRADIDEAVCRRCGCVRGGPSLSWRAPHENAAAQLKKRGNHLMTRREVDEMTRQVYLDTVADLRAQRTGEETI